MKSSYKELALIAENLGVLYEDGIEISLALDLLSELPLSKEYKLSIRGLRDTILKGGSLEDGFKLYPKLYPDFFIGIISVGENNGELTKVLISLSKYYGKLGRVKKEVVNALIYPLFLIISIISLGIFLTFVLIPSFYEAFSSFGGKIPGSIEFIYLLKKAFIEEPLASLIFTLSWGMLIPSIILSILIKKVKKSKIILRIRVIRDIYEYIFILILSVIINSGVPIVKGLAFCLESSDILFVKNELAQINNDVIRGIEMSNSLGNNKFISNYSLSMIRLGEVSGSVAMTFNKLEERLEKGTTEKINRIITLIQPILIITMAVVVFIFIYIFVIPMFDMMYGGVH
ncbi:type II secretion system F family protein [Clostridium paraputrificum]|uniref:type II secretion system F family protein n=1 Tax=Clostridium paraputrificum TaxID=29363 RepID=UPI003D327583